MYRRFVSLCSPFLSRSLKKTAPSITKTSALKCKILPNITKAIGNTPLVYLNRITKECHAKIAVKCEFMEPCSSGKDRIALEMIEDAENKGIINKNTVLIEATSGNTGIGLAFIAAAKGYHLKIVMPDNMSIERRILLKVFGCDVILTPGALGMEAACIKGKQLRETIPNSYMLEQFSNNVNVKSHFEYTGPELWKDTGGLIDYFVSGVGTSGTVTGVGKYLKSKRKDIRIIGVEPSESPVFNGGTPNSHQIQGIGAGFIPSIFDSSYIDHVMQCSSKDAIHMARRLAREEGILAGPSSGAAVVASLKLAQEPSNKGKLIVANMSDSGERYLSSDLYSKEREDMLNAPTCSMDGCFETHSIEESQKQLIGGK